jgi:UTP:GlnB (protein PII) uridylyltransferase
MVKDTAARWNLSPDDTFEWHFLVQHHLRMSYISQRRDLPDDTVIADCAFRRNSSTLKNCTCSLLLI